MGQALGTYNLPIMTMNAIVQALVPPPKHRIEALFECTVGGRAQIRDIVLMERGEEREDRLSVDDTVGRLIENTDDAYGFPPFSLFAPHIRIDGADYQALRARESELLGAAIATARTWYLQVPGHEWAERLPGIINRPLLVPVGPGTEAQLPPPVPVAMAVERPLVPKSSSATGSTSSSRSPRKVPPTDAPKAVRCAGAPHPSRSRAARAGQRSVAHAYPIDAVPVAHDTAHQKGEQTTASAPSAGARPQPALSPPTPGRQASSIDVREPSHCDAPARRAVRHLGPDGIGGAATRC